MQKVQVQQVDNQHGAVMEKFQYLNSFFHCHYELSFGCAGWKYYI